MANKIGISDFDIDTSTIPPDIVTLYSTLSKGRKTKLEMRFVSAYDFLVVLFHLRFIEGLEAKEIAERLGLHPVDARIHLYNFAWNYSPDYIENKALFEEKLSEARAALLEAKEKYYLLDNNQDSKLQASLKKAGNIREESYLKLGFKTGEEYVRVFYYLLHSKDVSPIMLSQLFGLAYGTLHDRLEKLGLNVSHPEGVKNKQNRGSQDYEQSLRHARITQTKSQLRNFSKGSTLEDYFRRQFADMIYQYIPSQRYEVVVGLSNVGILGKLEIDIPVMVYDVEKKIVHRFAIEYNGKYFHTDERDLEKRELCEHKGWHYLDIIEESDGRYANKPELLAPVLDEICKSVKNSVLQE